VLTTATRHPKTINERRLGASAVAQKVYGAHTSGVRVRSRHLHAVYLRLQNSGLGDFLLHELPVW
jgi:hypothetical protein